MVCGPWVEADAGEPPEKFHDHAFKPTPVLASVKVTDSPAHIVVVLVVKEAVGTLQLFTVIVTVAVLLQLPVVPVTVYVNVEAGVNATPSVTPLSHA
jgi:hypothetical protein